jgi:hypothetical protein
MGMSNWILDLEEKFWDHAQEIIGDCDSFKEFHTLMFDFDDITTTALNISKTRELDMFWDEFWT